MRTTTRTYPITRVIVANVATGATKAIPGLICTLAEVQGAVDSASDADIRCGICEESIADCPELKDRVRNIPAAWSYRAEA